MKNNIIALLILLPSALEAGHGWSQPLEVKSAIIAIDLLNEGTKDDVFSAILRYSIDHQGKPSLVGGKCGAIPKNNPAQDRLYEYNVTGNLIEICNGKATLEYAITKTKAGQEPIVILEQKSATLILLRKAMTHHEEVIENANKILSIDIYHSDQEVTPV